MADVIINDPTLAAFYEPPHRIVAVEATLTHDGEVLLIPIDRESIHEDAPLQIDVKGLDHDDQR